MPAPIQRRTVPLPPPTPKPAPHPQPKLTRSLGFTERQMSPDALVSAVAKPKVSLAPVIQPTAHVHIPTGLQDRFALALQSQAMPWAQSEAVILGLYAEDCEFHDPVMHFKDRASFIKYLKFMDTWGRVPRVDITESHLEGNVGTAKGSLYYQPKKGPGLRADFSTRMEFNDAGLIVKHEDKWNVVGTLISALLGRGKVPAEDGTVTD